jgi:Ca2+-binding RTX toxin-like protein
VNGRLRRFGAVVEDNMGIYTGTSGNDKITPAIVTAGVESTPEGSKPSADDDEINGLGGRDVLNGGGGNDTITAAGKGALVRGGTGNDTITYDTAENDVGVKAYGNAGDDQIHFNSAHLESGSPEGKLSFFGGSGNDKIDAYGLVFSDYGDVTIESYGQAGNDRLEALALGTFSVFDALDPGKNPDHLYGGGGNDSYLVREPQDLVIEKPGEGYDTVEIDHSPGGLDSYTLGPNIEKLVVEAPTVYGAGGCELVGNELNNVIAATTTADRVIGAAGNDTLYGGPLGDDAGEDDGADEMQGGTGNDTIYGAGGDDTLSGQAGNDTVYGESGLDRLVGGGGNDTLYGGEDNDILVGRAGADKLGGEGGDDVYDYDAPADSRPGARDVIYDFEGVGPAGGDVIDLSTIDAVAGNGNDTFAFIGTAAFTEPGQVRVRPLASGSLDTLVQANITGGAGAEMEIVVKDGDIVEPTQWSAEDFVL